jgi:hypothetical protein
MVAAVQRFSPIIFETGNTDPFVYDDNYNFIPLRTTFAIGFSQDKYVDAAGDDAIGNGSLSNPYLTVAKAMTAITDASSTKPYVVNVGPGVFTGNFAIKPWVFVIGSGRNATIINNSIANWLDASFSAAGSLDAGIQNCSIGTTTMVASFAAVTSPGTGRFFIYDCNFTVGYTLTGANTNNRFFVQNIQALVNALTYATLNCNGCRYSGCDWNNTVTLTHTAVYGSNVNATINNSSGTVLTITNAQVTPNVLTTILNCANFSTITLAGDGAFATCNTLSPRPRFIVTTADADTTFAFQVAAAAVGATHLINGGDNLVITAQTVNRTFTFQDPSGNSSRTGVRIINGNVNRASLVYTGANAGSSVTYLEPTQTVDLEFFSSVFHSFYPNMPQRGRGVFVGGASAAIPCDIVQTVSKVSITLSTAPGAGVPVGLPVVYDADITSGTRAGGGQFIARSINLTTGVQVATDNTPFAWEVVR